VLPGEHSTESAVCQSKTVGVQRACLCSQRLLFSPTPLDSLSDDLRWQQKEPQSSQPSQPSQPSLPSSSSSVSIPTATPTSLASLGVLPLLIRSDRVQCCCRLASISRRGASMFFLQPYSRAFAVGDGGTGKTTFVKVRRFSPLARPPNT
jgi:hypothetical protein